MASNSVTVRYHFELRDEEADGSACCRCGDVIFLGMSRFFMVFTEPKNLAATPSNLVFCQSCREGIEEELSL